jgi:hypothetical protein
VEGAASLAVIVSRATSPSTTKPAGLCVRDNLDFGHSGAIPDDPLGNHFNRLATEVYERKPERKLNLITIYYACVSHFKIAASGVLDDAE